MIISLEIPGDPVSKQSFRYTRSGIKYKDKKVVVQEAYIKLIATSVKPETLLMGPLRVSIIVYISMPRYILNSKKKRAFAIAQKLLPTKKPDCDNITKLILDALEKVIYNNDSQICVYNFQKFYSDNPRTEIIIEELEEFNENI